MKTMVRMGTRVAHWAFSGAIALCLGMAGSACERGEPKRPASATPPPFEAARANEATLVKLRFDDGTVVTLQRSDEGEWKAQRGSQQCPASTSVVKTLLSTLTHLARSPLPGAISGKSPAELGLSQPRAHLHVAMDDRILLSLRAGTATMGGYAAQFESESEEAQAEPFQLTSFDLSGARRAAADLCEDDSAAAKGVRAPLVIDQRTWFARLADQIQGRTSHCPITDAARPADSRARCVSENIEAARLLQACAVEVAIAGATSTLRDGRTYLALPTDRAQMTPLGKVWVDGALVAIRGAMPGAKVASRLAEICDGANAPSTVTQALVQPPNALSVPDGEATLQLSVLLDGSNGDPCAAHDRIRAPTGRAVAMRLSDANDDTAQGEWHALGAAAPATSCARSERFFSSTEVVPVAVAAGLP